VAIQVYGVKYACDLCGTVAAAGTEMPNDPPPIFAQAPVPEGWANLALMSLSFKDLYGSMITHLCPVCAGLSIGELAARLQIQYGEKIRSGR
jgi:hypothetical protein